MQRLFPGSDAWHRAVSAVGLITVTIAVVVSTACSSGNSNRDLAASNGEGGGSPSASRSWAGSQPAPAFPTGLTWFNVQHPLTLDELRGKAVLLDFWTIGCINCYHIIPDLQRLESQFGKNLVIIGVQSGKYSSQSNNAAIEAVAQEYGLDHPLVNDPDFTFWNAYEANAWPTLVLIDPAGKIVGAHAGEGVYPLFQPIIKSLLSEFQGRLDSKPLPLALKSETSSTILSFPGDVLADATGDRLFIADSGHNRVVVTSLAGVVQYVIGSGKSGFADGGATEAEFNAPQGLALSADGKTLYIADTRNNAIRSVNLATKQVTTIAGTGQQLEQLPSAGARASTTPLSSPWGLTVQGGTLYIAMAGIHQLWAMDLQAGTIAVYAGTSREGIDDGSRLSQATLAQPSGLTSGNGSLYWVDPESSSLRTLNLQGNDVETLIGTGLFKWGNKDGKGLAAQLQHAQGVVMGDGKLYLADTFNHEVRVFDPTTRELTTLAGTGSPGWKDGSGKSAEFDSPSGVGYANGKVYVADTNNGLIRVVDAGTGEVSTLALSNVSAAAGISGAAKQVTLAEQTVAPGAANLRVSFTAPKGYQLNSLAPSVVNLSTSDGAVLQLGESTLHWASDNQSVAIPVPIQLTAGAATLTAQASVYYCRDGQQALCFIGQVDFTLPVKVKAGAQASELHIAYDLPAS